MEKTKIVNYILDNVHLSNNIIVTTTREIAKATNTSTQTVTRTLKILEEGNIIKRRTGALMLNPELLMRGDDQNKNTSYSNLGTLSKRQQKNKIMHYLNTILSRNSIILNSSTL